MMRNGAANCPTKSAQLFFRDIFKIADMAIEPSASPRNKLEGTVDVCRSIAPVILSSFACPRSTRVSMNSPFTQTLTSRDEKLSGKDITIEDCLRYRAKTFGCRRMIIAG
jgi:hypothetical protein